MGACVNNGDCCSTQGHFLTRDHLRGEWWGLSITVGDLVTVQLFRSTNEDVERRTHL